MCLLLKHNLAYTGCDDLSIISLVCLLPKQSAITPSETVQVLVCGGTLQLLKSDQVVHPPEPRQDHPSTARLRATRLTPEITIRYSMNAPPLKKRMR